MKKQVVIIGLFLTIAATYAHAGITVLSQECSVDFYHWDPSSEYSYTDSSPSSAYAGGVYVEGSASIVRDASHTRLHISGWATPAFMVTESALPSVELIFTTQEPIFDMFVESHSPFGDYQVGLEFLDLTDNNVIYRATYADESHNLSFELDTEHRYRIYIDGGPLGNNVYQLDVTLPVVIPTPTTFVLISIGAGCINWLRRRRIL